MQKIVGSEMTRGELIELFKNYCRRNPTNNWQSKAHELWLEFRATYREKFNVPWYWDQSCRDKLIDDPEFEQYWIKKLGK